MLREGILVRYRSLYLFHICYFSTLGFAAFIPKFYGEIGLLDGQIGLLTSLPTIVGLLAMPLMGALTDRIALKRHVLVLCLGVMGVSCLLVEQCSNFLWMLLPVTGYTVFSASLLPVTTTISIEYCRETGHVYGPIRLFGTIGYQLGAILVGLALTRSLRGLYPMMGIMMFVSLDVTFMMPNIRGHQHSRRRIPFRRLFEDRAVCRLYLIILLATIPTQFYTSFFAKHLGDLGMGNGVASVITFFSVALELPFLAMGDRLFKKMSVWNWLLVGMALNGVRWLGLAFSKSAVSILIFQLPTVSVLACFEFFPALYLNRRIAPEMQGSAQTMLTLTTFCAAKIIGSLLGGYVCQWVGIPVVFEFCGIATLLGCAALIPLIRRMNREEGLKAGIDESFTGAV